MKTIILDGVEYNLTPKARFKPDDWVVYYRNDSSREVLQVYDIRDSRYYFTDNVHFSWSVKECDEKSHLWTIQDAKDGDVLVYNNGAVEIILLFKEWKNGYIGIANTYVHMFDNNIKISNWCDCSYTACPATKEQRDLLFKKMHEAGYKWDAEKKELKLYITNGGNFESENCKQKFSWSEEDDDDAWMNDIISKVENNLQLNKAEIDWLKSLKTRHTWKPSDEQIGVIESLINNRPCKRKHLDSLYNDLKKLREDRL